MDKLNSKLNSKSNYESNYELNPASDEQNRIINGIKNSNILVNAVAGSGKTTTILHIGKKYPMLNILVLTYNSKLKIESREKCKIFGLTNVEVHSYHAFCVKYYDKNCFTDAKMRNMLNKKRKNKVRFNYDLVIIDECQDMTPLYYELFCTIMAEHKGKPKICILGDVYQSIFQFNNADPRFMLFADQLFDFNDYGWKTLKLSTSYRVTREMATFVNYCVLGEHRMDAIKDGIKVKYCICDVFGHSGYTPYEEVVAFLSKYNYDDIFVLVPSLKSGRSPARVLANRLTGEGIPIYVPGDDEKLDNDIIQGKICFSTFHQSKGLERKVVVVLGFDSFLFNILKNKNKNKCPNELYVAITRASEQLVVMHHYQNDYLPFLDRSKLRSLTDFRMYRKPFVQESKKREISDLGVTELLKHLPDNILEEAMGYLKVKKICEPDKKIKIDIKTKQNELYENVSEITGTAIPSYFEYQMRGNMSIYQTLFRFKMLDSCGKEDGKEDDDNVVSVDVYGDNGKKEEQDYMFIDSSESDSSESDSNESYESSEESEEVDLLDIQTMSIKKLLILANMFCSYMSGYLYKLSQIKKYDWLTQDKLDLCMVRLKKEISKDAVFERIVEYEHDELAKNYKRLKGSIDCVDNDNVWEFKCVEELKDEHFLQLGIYAFLLNQYDYQRIMEEVNLLDGLAIELKVGNIVGILTKDKMGEKLVKGKIAKIYKNEKLKLKLDNGKSRNVIRKEIVWTNRIELMKKKVYKDRISKLPNYKYYLFNILTGEKYLIETDYQKLQDMIDYLVHQKYNNATGKSDKELLDIANDIKSVTTV